MHGKRKKVSEVVSLWKDGYNLGVLSSTEPRVIEELRLWAKERGYQIKPEPEEKED